MMPNTTAAHVMSPNVAASRMAGSARSAIVTAIDVVSTGFVLIFRVNSVR